MSVIGKERCQFINALIRIENDGMQLIYIRCRWQRYAHQFDECKFVIVIALTLLPVIALTLLHSRIITLRYSTHELYLC